MPTLLDADLSATFAPSRVVMVLDQRLLLEIDLTVTVACRLELQIEGGKGEVGAEAGAWPWFQEVGAVAAGATVEQAPLTRVIPSAAATLAPGAHRLLLDVSPHRAPLARVQVRAVAGSAHARITSIYGLAAA